MAEEEQRRIELVAENDNSKQEALRVGAGLMTGLFLGRNSLLAAANGSEQFEFAIAHFVALVLACVAGSLFIGSIFDRYRKAIEEEEAAAEAEAIEDGHDRPDQLAPGADAIPLTAPNPLSDSLSDPTPTGLPTDLTPGFPT